MAGPILKACKNCNFISEDDVCPRCGGQTSKEWQGYVAIIDYTKSEIAKRMSINANGRYALKVR
ncbi:MAG: transcription elongation factor subunit Spt4 [Candidatus Methanomethylophilaceae archaeon]|nr:DNA-directed polymerase subunit [Candidatus Methanomethylophilaceae archaeon]